jgi:acetyl esterase
MVARHAPQAEGRRTLQREDYDRLIDEEVWAFIRRTHACFPPEAAQIPLPRQRQIYDAMCREFHPGRPGNVQVEDFVVQSAERPLTVRSYRRSETAPHATIVYYHGGGFILGGLDSHDDICAELCAQSGYEVLSPDYRLAPEHLHPAAFDDAAATFAWAAAASDRPILLCGESAGGNLAAAVAHATRNASRQAVGQVLVYPSLGGDVSDGSYVAHADAPMLSTRDTLFYRAVRFAPGAYAEDVRVAPLADTDFSRLPPTIVFTAQCDPLSSDGEAYRDRILRAGGKAAWHEEAGLVHSYLRARRMSRKAAQAFDRIVSALSALGRGDWPH